MSERHEPTGIRRPKRVRQVHTQSIEATPDDVFPLLCPVRELDWAPGWTTDWVLSETGLVEKECMFRTPPKEGATAPSIWIVTRHEPAIHEVEMYKVTPGLTVGKLAISLAPRGIAGTAATISYEYTSLGPLGDRFLEEFTESWYEQFMRKWEAAMNHFLRTGRAIA